MDTSIRIKRFTYRLAIFNVLLETIVISSLVGLSISPPAAHLLAILFFASTLFSVIGVFLFLKSRSLWKARYNLIAGLFQMVIVLVNTTLIILFA